MHSSLVLNALAIFGTCFAISVPLYSSPNNFYYASVEVGGQAVYLFVDSGAPETWLATNQTVCYGVRGERASCSFHFGKRYNPGSTFTSNNETGNVASITYADGSEVGGTYGFDDLTVGNVVLSQALIVLADYEVSTSGGQWPTSGLLGLGPELPPDPEGIPLETKLSMTKDLSQPFALAKPRYALTQHQRAVGSGNGVLSTIFNQTELPAFFGLALSRTTSNHTLRSSTSVYGGLLTIGEEANLTAPHINATASETFVRVPLAKEASYYDDSLAYRHWVINCSGMVAGKDLDTALGYPFVEGAETDVSFIVDSGTEINYVPALHAALVNALFQPPATFSSGGVWLVECTAKAPEIGFFISRQVFPINAIDMVAEFQLENRTTVCASTIQASGGGSYVLGSPFLKNVYAETYREEYDGPEAATMWLASRQYYAAF